MSCDEVAPLLAEAWAGEIAASDRIRLESHLARCPACRAEADELEAVWQTLGSLGSPVPTARLRARFDPWLAGYGAAQADASPPPPRVSTLVSHSRRWLVPALGGAAALVAAAAGFVLGVEATRPTLTTEITSMRQEIVDLRRTLALSLLQHGSAHERLRGLTVSETLDRPDATVLAALLTTLERDANVNVRLAALEALRGFASDAAVRDGLIKVLAQTSKQSPLVQIAVIDALVDLREQRARSAIERLARDDNGDESVKSRANAALAQL